MEQKRYTGEENLRLDTDNELQALLDGEIVTFRNELDAVASDID